MRVCVCHIIGLTVCFMAYSVDSSFDWVVTCRCRIRYGECNDKSIQALNRYQITRSSNSFCLPRFEKRSYCSADRSDTCVYNVHIQNCNADTPHVLDLYQLASGGDACRYEFQVAFECILYSEFDRGVLRGNRH